MSARRAWRATLARPLGTHARRRAQGAGTRGQDARGGALGAVVAAGLYSCPWQLQMRGASCNGMRKRAAVARETGHWGCGRRHAWARR